MHTRLDWSMVGMIRSRQQSQLEPMRRLAIGCTTVVQDRLMLSAVAQHVPYDAVGLLDLEVCREALQFTGRFCLIYLLFIAATSKNRAVHWAF